MAGCAEEVTSHWILSGVRIGMVPNLLHQSRKLMSDFFVSIVEMIARLWREDPGSPRTCVLGEHERREARRSAAWVFGALVVFFLLGWWLWRWITG